eukprot:scaffold201942_cov26-Prasinocladus_malaysianus.AAC.2
MLQGKAQADLSRLQWHSYMMKRASGAQPSGLVGLATSALWEEAQQYFAMEKEIALLRAALKPIKHHQRPGKEKSVDCTSSKQNKSIHSGCGLQLAEGAVAHSIQQSCDTPSMLPDEMDAPVHVASAANKSNGTNWADELVGVLGSG